MEAFRYTAFVPPACTSVLLLALSSSLASIAVCLPSFVETCNECTGRVHAFREVDRQIGHPIISSRTNEMIGQAFYSPAAAISDRFFALCCRSISSIIAIGV